MSVDTHGRIKGHISIYDLADYIKEKYGSARIGDITKREDKPDYLYGIIDFKDGNDCRIMSYYYNPESKENYEYWVQHGLKEMVDAKTTNLTLSCWGNSEVIIKDIISHFGGGWLDANDCDDTYYYFVPAADGADFRKYKDDMTHIMQSDIHSLYGPRVCLHLDNGETVTIMNSSANISKDMLKGYDIVDFDGTGLLEIQKTDDTSIFDTDEDAVKQAVKDGISVIPIDELPAEFKRRYLGWIDTPENRKAIENYCKRNRKTS